MIRCSICGSEKYGKFGNTTGGRWVFQCRKCMQYWTIVGMDINEEFPWQEDDPYHPKYYTLDTFGRYCRIDDLNARIPDRNLTQWQADYRNRAKEQSLGKA